VPMQLVAPCRAHLQARCQEIDQPLGIAQLALCHPVEFLEQQRLVLPERRVEVGGEADVAAGLQIDLSTATDLVGRAMVGETGTLKRYGIIVKEGADAVETATAAMWDPYLAYRYYLAENEEK